MKKFLFILCTLGTLSGAFVLYDIGVQIGVNREQIKNATPTKPISYPKLIQIAKAGDTLVVVSVSDSIYLGFKNK